MSVISRRLTFQARKFQARRQTINTPSRKVSELPFTTSYLSTMQLIRRQLSSIEYITSLRNKTQYRLTLSGRTSEPARVGSTRSMSKFVNTVIVCCITQRKNLKRYTSRVWRTTTTTTRSTTYLFTID